MPCPGFLTKKIDVIQSINLYVLKEPPPEWLWLEHDFMSLTLQQMRTIYKEFNSHMTTLCDEDRIDLETCYSIKYEEQEEQEEQEKKEEQEEKEEQEKKEKEEQEKKDKQFKIPFMKKPKKKLNLNFF